MIKRLALLLLAMAPAFAAFNGTATWYLDEANGASTNAGGWDPGVASPGTQQTTGVAITVTLTAGTTGTCSITCSSTTYGPGNFINIASGSGCSTGLFEILSQAAGTITVDHTMGTATDACVGVIGGPFAAFSSVTGQYVAGNTINVKATGIYSVSATVSFATAGTSGNQVVVQGYTTTPGDGGSATVQASGTSYYIFTNGGAYVTIQNFKLNCNSETSCGGITGSAAFDYWNNLEIENFKAIGANNSGGITLATNLYIHGGASCTEGYNSSGRNALTFSVITGNACPGVVSAGNGVLLHNIIAANTGASSDGIQMTGGALTNEAGQIINNTIDANGRDGIRFTAASGADQLQIENNLITNNGGYGINSTTTNYTAGNPPYAPNYNGFYGNTTAARNQFPAGANDVTMTGTPYANTSGGNYALNGTTGAGAAANGAGFPGSFKGISTTGYISLGAVQPQSVSSGAVASGAPIQ